MVCVKDILLALAAAASVHGAAIAQDATLEKRVTTSPSGTKQGCLWQVPNVGGFTTNVKIDYSAFNTIPGDFVASPYTVAANGAPYSRRFDLSNVQYVPLQYLALTVPGGQSASPISSAQLQTEYGDILYGSVRTVAMVSPVGGTTHGFTMYSNDFQEVDLAFLTYNDGQVHYTNEPNSYSSPTTSFVGTAPADAATTYHEYRVDWTAGQTSFYIDSVLQRTITTNAPSTPGFWIWNNWSNGGAWTGGPPATNNVLKIQSINAYFNRTSITSTTCM